MCVCGGFFFSALGEPLPCSSLDLTQAIAGCTGDLVLSVFEMFIFNSSSYLIQVTYLIFFSLYYSIISLFVPGA